MDIRSNRFGEIKCFEFSGKSKRQYLLSKEEIIKLFSRLDTRTINPIIEDIGAFELIKTLPYFDENTRNRLKAGLLMEGLLKVPSSPNQIDADFMALIYCYNTIGECDKGEEAKKIFRMNIVRKVIYSDFPSITEHQLGLEEHAKFSMFQDLEGRTLAKEFENMSNEEFEKAYGTDFILWFSKINQRFYEFHQEQISSKEQTGN